MSQSLLLHLLSIGASLYLVAHLRAEPVDAILKRMNADARKFNSVSATMHQVDYNALLKDSSNSSAQVRIRRSKGSFSGVLEYQPPDERTVGFAGHVVKIYYPKANQVTQISAGAYLSHVSQFLLFGTSGDELQKTYNITAAGTETVAATPTTHLVLTPKSSDLQKMITKLEVWIPQDKSYPVQEKATEPSQNAEIFSFSEVRMNPSLPGSAFELKIPRGAKVISQK